MTKYHIKENGEPDKCTAEQGKCPLNPLAPHFDSREAARSAYERVHSEAYRKSSAEHLHEIRQLNQQMYDINRFVQLADRLDDPIFRQNLDRELFSRKPSISLTAGFTEEDVEMFSYPPLSLRD